MVERLCDELVILADGQVQAQGTRQELLASAAEPEWELHVDADTGWVRDAGVDVQAFDGGRVRFVAGSPEQANQVLTEAQRRGTVHHFGRVSRTLHEIFKETIQ